MFNITIMVHKVCVRRQHPVALLYTSIYRWHFDVTINLYIYILKFIASLKNTPWR